MFSTLITIVPLLGFAVSPVPAPSLSQVSVGHATPAVTPAPATHGTVGTSASGQRAAEARFRRADARRKAAGSSCEGEFQDMSDALAGFWAASDAMGACGGCASGAFSTMLALSDLGNAAGRFAVCTAVS